MLTAFTHAPSPYLGQCELTYLPRQSIDIEVIKTQHIDYCDMLRRCGVTVLTFNHNDRLPDSVFVEDTALVLDEIGIILSMGTESRREENTFIASQLAKYRALERIRQPAQLEGGDILQIGKDLYVGLTSRSNQLGAQALANIVAPFGYRVETVEVIECLHLKTGCTALDENNVLINPQWVDSASFEKLNQLNVPPEEEFAANILRLGDIICMPSGFPRTRKMIEDLGYKVMVIDISEFQKAEAGLTCISLLIKSV
ncbi:MAG: dimethylargininase [Desulfobacterales bacterium]|nr:dimethylargininase [Desulfobacterales bacterium]